MTAQLFVCSTIRVPAKHPDCPDCGEPLKRGLEGWICNCPWVNRPRFALDADVTVYWPDVRPVWEQSDKGDL